MDLGLAGKTVLVTGGSRGIGLANMIVFAASDAASYVNGAVLVADGAQDKS